MVVVWWKGKNVLHRIKRKGDLSGRGNVRGNMSGGIRSEGNVRIPPYHTIPYHTIPYHIVLKMKTIQERNVGLPEEPNGRFVEPVVNRHKAMKLNTNHHLVSGVVACTFMLLLRPFSCVVVTRFFRFMTVNKTKSQNSNFAWSLAAARGLLPLMPGP